MRVNEILKNKITSLKTVLHYKINIFLTLIAALIAVSAFQNVSYGLSYNTLYSQEKILRSKNAAQYTKFKFIIAGYDSLFKKSPNSYKGALAAIRMLDLYRYLSRKNHSLFFQDRVRQSAYEIIKYSKNGRARAYSYFAIYDLYKKQKISTYLLWKKKLLNEYPDSWEAKLVLKDKKKFSSEKLVFSAKYADQLKPLSGKIIVIDPGHGGKDPGASGYFGIKEKNLVLEIAKKLYRSLKKEGATVLLTRSTDRFITLEKRAEFANRHHADAFISIHANASRNKKLSGIETFFLTTKADKKTLLIASRENGITPAQMGVLQKILVGLVQNAKIGRSSILAKDIQEDIFKMLHTKRTNLGVRQAPFYVLAGTKVSSVLIEVGFITNRNEAKLLLNKSYQEQIVSGISDGVEKFFGYK